MRQPLFFIFSIFFVAEGHTACTKAEWELLLSNPFLATSLWTTTDKHPDLPKNCKKTASERFLTLLETQAKQGLCPLAICQDIDKIIEALNGKELTTANVWTAKAFIQELDIVEEKLDMGMIPHCLLPKGCETTGSRCRQVLLREFLDRDSMNQSSDSEQRLNVGSFLHLLLADAFTCGSDKQKGGTCALYSGANLMAHYCATPARNPNAWNTCSAKGPGFECILPDQFFKEAYQAGAWRAQLCWGDPETGLSKCKPALENPYYDEEEDRLEDQYKSNCEQQDPEDSDRIRYCTSIQDQLADIRKTAALLASQDEYHPEAQLMHKAGARLNQLASVYERHGFKVVLYEASNADWTRILESLKEGHPVQTAFTPQGWATYDAKNPGSHAVILEGRFAGRSGVEMILFVDSNNPDEVKIMTAPKLKDDFLKNGGGALGLRP